MLDFFNMLTNVTPPPSLFAISDISHVKDKIGKPLPGLAPVAKQEGKFVADVIKNKIHNVKTQNKFYYKNRGYLATIGRSKAIVDFGWFM